MNVSELQLLGAGCFGAIIGWYVYYVNRYRKAEVQFSDIVTLVGAIGGAAILNLFPAQTGLFGAYGVGLFIGFFGYFLILCALVAASKNFNADFFLDGRRKRPAEDEYIPGPDEPGGGQRPTLTSSQDRQTVIVIPPDAIRLGAGAKASEYRTMLRLLSSDVTAVCKAQWPAHKMDCNDFAKAVAGEFGVTLTGNADSILDQISGSGWTSLGTDGVAASAAAAQGKLVVGGVKSADLGDAHGHVVIVVAPTGPLGHDKYPYAYWGSLNAAIRNDGGLGKTVNFSFNSVARDKVFYASMDI